MGHLSRHLKGLLITVAGVLVLSPDALLIRLVAADHWTTVWWRTVLTVIGLGAFLALRHRRAVLRRFLDALVWPGVLVVGFFAASTVSFVFSITHTAVANTLIIWSSAPLFAALFSRVFLAEPVRGETWAAILIVIASIGTIFSGSLAGGTLAGDAAALGASVLSAGSLVVLRHARSANPMPMLLLGSLLAAIAVSPLAAPSSVSARDLVFLALLGLVVLPLAFSLVFIGPKYIPAPEVGLIMLLETPLGSLWVWLALAEAPTGAVLLAGIVIVATIAVHCVIGLKRAAPRAAAQPFHTPSA